MKWFKLFQKSVILSVVEGLDTIFMQKITQIDDFRCQIMSGRVSHWERDVSGPGNLALFQYY